MRHRCNRSSNNTEKPKLECSIRNLGIVCGAVLLILIMLVINPTVGSDGDAYAMISESLLNGKSSIAVTISNSKGIELNDNDTVSTTTMPGSVSYISNTIHIVTNRIKQYHITVQAAEGSSNSLTGEYNKNTISPISRTMRPSDFETNTWGYAIGSSNIGDGELDYSPLPNYNDSSMMPYSSTINPADGEYSLKLNFAARIDNDKPTDHYRTTSLISIVADAKELTLMDIDKMQDMTADICNATPAPTAEGIKNKTYDEIIAATPSKQLKDTRDGKYYWVSKLADGHCWMTQNLDFDIPTTLSSADTDIQEDTEGVIKTITTSTAKVAAPNNWPTYANASDTYNAYYNSGDYIYNGPSDPAHGQGTSCSANNSNADALAPCAQFSKSSIDNTNAQVLGDTNRHYHVGNYYSFSAATAKSGDDITSGSALQSICPKGWSLPTGSNNGQFAELLTKYGVNNSLTNGSYAIYKEPLYFVYGGALANSMLGSANNQGRYWSSIVDSSTHAFGLGFNSNVSPNNSYGRYAGFSIRCIAR